MGDHGIHMEAHHFLVWHGQVKLHLDEYSLHWHNMNLYIKTAPSWLCKQNEISKFLIYKFFCADVMQFFPFLPICFVPKYFMVIIVKNNLYTNY